MICCPWIMCNWRNGPAFSGWVVSSVSVARCAKVSNTPTSDILNYTLKNAVSYFCVTSANSATNKNEHSCSICDQNIRPHHINLNWISKPLTKLHSFSFSPFDQIRKSNRSIFYIYLYIFLKEMTKNKTI